MYIASIFFSFIYAHWMYVPTHLKIMGQWKSTLIDKFTLKKKDLLKFFWASFFLLYPGQYQTWEYERSSG